MSKVERAKTRIDAGFYERCDVIVKTVDLVINDLFKEENEHREREAFEMTVGDRFE